MNCKPGDLAVVAVPPTEKGGPVYARPNLGRVCTAIRLATLADFPIPVAPTVFAKHGPIWVTEGATFAWCFYGEVVEWNLAPDSRLRPLRDDPGADETLTWAALPSTGGLVEPA